MTPAEPGPRFPKQQDVPMMPRYHLHREDWIKTPEGQSRGYIQPKNLKELWFHTGTVCNLSCPFCLEGSGPGDARIDPLTFQDARPFLDEALECGVEQFSFTGGEPFVVKDISRILDYALSYRPCLVLTNATAPLEKRLPEVLPLLENPHPLSFRVSLDYPDPERHDGGRGTGAFYKTLSVAKRLFDSGFPVSIARRQLPLERREAVDNAFVPFLVKAGLPRETLIIRFPDLLRPGCSAAVPQITETCMTMYKSEEDRQAFMCNFSKMVAKQSGRVRVYACTLVDDDQDYALGTALKDTLDVRVMLKHHRCYACFSSGTSCSQ